MSDQRTFQDVTRDFFEYHGDKKYQEAYDLITIEGSNYPDQTAFVFGWRFCAAALMNESDLALEIIKDSLDAGIWWSEEYLRSDEDLKSLQELPAFNELVGRSEKMYQGVVADTKPLAMPLSLPNTSEKEYPTLLAMHGNMSNAENSVENWESAVNAGWLTVLLQSSQLFLPDRYVWNDLELGGEEIKAHSENLIENYDINEEQIVLGGFSKGGEMSVWYTLQEITPVAGFVAVNPGGPFIQEPEKFLPIISKCKRLNEMRGFFLVGENDGSLENIKKLHALLNSHGMECKLVVSPDIAHDFPEDFPEILADALQFVTKKLPRTL